jgi:hypothetical protein
VVGSTTPRRRAVGALPARSTGSAPRPNSSAPFLAVVADRLRSCHRQESMRQ